CLRPTLRYRPFFLTTSTSTQIYTLSLHDALPILSDIEGQIRLENAIDQVLENYYEDSSEPFVELNLMTASDKNNSGLKDKWFRRSEEHTSELQSRFDLVCRLLLEKKNKSNQHTQD